MICLLSSRRMGKSKLIQFCYEKQEMADSHYTFYIDILHTTSLQEFTFAFGQSVFAQLHSQRRRLRYAPFSANSPVRKAFLALA